MDEIAASLNCFESIVSGIQAGNIKRKEEKMKRHK